MKKRHIIQSLILLGLLCVAETAFAGTATVSNSVYTEANSGGGGNATVSSNVKTVINGEVVEDYSETKTSTGNEPVSIDYESTHSVSGDDVHTDVEANVTADTDIYTDTEANGDAELEEESLSETDEMNTGTTTEEKGDSNFIARLGLFFKTYVFWWL